MKTAVTVDLDGATFVLDEGAFLALRSYLDRAAARLRNHPDRAAVIAGLERSIGAQLARGPAAQGVPLDEGEMVAALKEVGRVDGPELGDPASSARGASAAGRSSAGPSAAGPSGAGRSSAGPSAAGPSFRARVCGRRLYRLREGQHIAGVCTGLAAFADVDVNMIRFIFLLGTAFSGGVLLVGYVLLMFVMPIARTEAEIAAAQGGMPDGLTRE